MAWQLIVSPRPSWPRIFSRSCSSRPRRGAFWPGGVVFMLALFSAARLLAQVGLPTNSIGWLDYWPFSDTKNWTTELGYAPISFTNLSVSDWGDGMALLMDSPDPAWLQYAVTESDGTTNITTTTGSWMFWFMPNWAGANTNGTGPGVAGRLIEVGASNSAASYGWFSLYLDSPGTNITFSAQTNNGTTTNYLSSSICWTSNRWHFIVLTFSPTNSDLYIDTVLAASGPGVTIRPPADVLSNGFYLLSDETGELQAQGAMDDFVTYNVVLDTNTITQTYKALEIYYLLNPLNPSSWASPNFSPAPSSPVAGSSFQAISGPGDLECVGTNVATVGTNMWNVWFTNVAVTVGTNLAPVLASNGAVVYVTNPLVNLTFSIAGGSNGVYYDVFATPALTMPPSNGVWSWMGQGVAGSRFTIANLTNGAVFLLLGTPYDPDGDGLTVAYERLVSHSNPYSNSINPAMLNGWAVLWELDPFAIYDQSEFPDAPLARLGYWKFNNTNNWTNEGGLYPTETVGIMPSNSFSGNAVSLTSSNSQLIYPVTSNGTNYFDPANGTIRFWFQPNWSNGGSGAPTYTNGQIFFRANATGFIWSLGFQLIGTSMYVMRFDTESNQCFQSYTFQTGLNGAPMMFQSNLWYQFVFTYSPTNMALYTNGVLFATANWPPYATNIPNYGVGDGMVYYPPASNLTAGFSFGNEAGQPCGVLGQLDELETFNYPLTAQQVAAGYPTFGMNTSNMLDSYYLGVSDMLQTYVYGFPRPAATNVIPVRLGYWRFDSPLLYAEQGQAPLSSYDVSVAPSWSGTALVLNNNAASQITYPDVGSNGWANINCQEGTLRFWFKENGDPTYYPAPFIYMGGPNTTNEWTLEETIHHSISFVTQTNFILGPTVVSCLSTSTWTQIVLTYGPTNCDLYTNGVLAASSAGNTNWPSLANRQLGMVIGNNMSNNASINGQFEEMETFNYQLAASNILANFQIVSNVDSNLDGIPDYLEDIGLSKARPFLGQPVVITGTIEAEQFDMGGPGIAYSNTFTPPATNSYRPTGMMISPCTDLGVGYCLDQMQSNEWAQYTINVLVAQLYMIETRVAGIGYTGGVFQVEFTSTNGFDTNTGPLTVPTTNWNTVTNVVYLANGIYTMKLHCLTNANAPVGTNVGRFNYISIYPYWAPPTNGPGSNNVSLSSGSSYATALSNAVAIQTAVNNLGSAGGSVTITNTSGTFMIAQASPNEANDAYQNAAVSITNSNVQIGGMGESNTTLIAYNRATTIFSVGKNAFNTPFQCSNFTLCDMTLEGQPHEAVTSTTNVTYVAGQFVPPTIDTFQADTGALTMLYGLNSSAFAYNILFTNCQFLYDDRFIVATGGTYISNVMVRACSFVPTGGTDTYGNLNTYSNLLGSWTVEVAFYARADGGYYNVVVIDNTYNGNPLITTTNTNTAAPISVSGMANMTNQSQWLAPDGLVWLQQAGNAFVARNFITNNQLEAVALNAGPASVVGNTFYTLVNVPECCALNGDVTGSGLPDTGSEDNSITFIGNWVYGDRVGDRMVNSPSLTTASALNFSGNWLNLSPIIPGFNDPGPGSAVFMQSCQSGRIMGNKMVGGGLGLQFLLACTNVLVMNNDFGAATYGGIGYSYIGDSITTAQIFSNVLGQGVTFHVQLPYTNSFSWFLGGNTYWDTHSNSIPLFTDPASSAIHIYN
jgi:hypothetical protein